MYGHIYFFFKLAFDLDFTVIVSAGVNTNI